MCGRYALALRPAQVRQMLQDNNMPAYDAPDDDGDGAPRQSYNFAPGYHGIVYRADVPDWGAGPRSQRKKDGATSTDAADAAEMNEPAEPRPSSSASQQQQQQDENSPSSSPSEEVQYKLQSMKWGLVPFWTKRNPDYGSMMKTINCRDDSLAQAGGMWSPMKTRKRCVVVAQGFYEWLKKDGGGRGAKMPHFVKRRDGKLMCFAGLWDVVQYENDDQKHYTYTIITTDSNKQLNFLHDRMPVILDNGSEALRMWLDPKRHEWSKELQSLLKPFEGELDVYPVSKDVGKVGNNSPTFIIPIDSKENKSNIANFFAKGAAKKEEEKKPIKKQQQPEVEVKQEEGFVAEERDSKKNTKNEEEEDGKKGVKREADDNLADEEKPPKKMVHTTSEEATATVSMNTTQSPSPQKQKHGDRPKISSTSNGTQSPDKAKQKQPGTQKITKFFANSS